MIYNFISWKKEISTKLLEPVFIPEFLPIQVLFVFKNNTGTTHRIIAELIDLGVENTEIPTLFDNSSTVDYNYWVGHPEYESFQAHHTAYTTLTQEELNSFDYVKGDTEGIVNYGLSIRNRFYRYIYRK
jgi:phosphoesterase RecJ-like protein